MAKVTQSFTPSPVKFIQQVGTNVNASTSPAFVNIIGAGVGSLIVPASPGDIIRVEIRGYFQTTGTTGGAILHIDCNGTTLGSIGLTIPQAAGISFAYNMITDCLVVSNTLVSGTTTSIFNDPTSPLNPPMAQTKFDNRGGVATGPTSSYTINAQVQFAGPVAGLFMQNFAAIVTVLHV